MLILKHKCKKYKRNDNTQHQRKSYLFTHFSTLRGLFRIKRTEIDRKRSQALKGLKFYKLDALFNSQRSTECKK